MNQLIILRRQISSREQLIENINDEIKTIEGQIEENNDILNALKSDLEKIREDYAAMIYFAFKNRSAYNRLMFIFAASDFNQAYKRLKYFQQYSAYRKLQAELIEKTEKELTAATAELEKSKGEKVALLSSLENEKNKLSRERKQQDVTMQYLVKKEKELMTTIREKEIAAKKLQKEIEKIIAEEIKLASRKEGTTSTSSYALTPEEMALSSDFEQNKGGLPWPLGRGVISSTFGEHEHPVLKEVMIKNNGIDIITDENAKARTIFGGEITRVMTIPNYNYVVMIRHGEYLSVYSNLDEVYVQKGDKVEIKQEIGRIHTDPRELKTELHFELWKGKTLLNPESWLVK
jgi:septal ring factor EnvC (AmiA/AmiB activator)